MKGLAATIGLLALSGCAALPAGEPAPIDAAAAGEAVDCIETRRISHTNVRGDRLIDFHMSGGRVYRNELPHACPGLGFERGFTYRPAADRLCSTDMITVRQAGGAGPSCGLGRFVPIAPPPR